MLSILEEIGRLAIVSPPPHEGRQMLFLRTSPSGDFTPELNMTSATFLWELECVCLPTRLQTQSTENRNDKSCLWVSRTIPALLLKTWCTFISLPP